MKMMLLLVAFAATVFDAQLAAGETWYCAVNDKISGAEMQEFRVYGYTLREMTSDKLLQDWAPDKSKFYGNEYNILHNDKYSIIAESDYSGVNDQKNLEVYVNNIIIIKGNGNLLYTTILTHLPAPNEIQTVYGSCTEGGK